MKLFTKLPHRSYIIVSTVLMILGLFAHYFWIYLPDREELLIAKRTRDLQQIAKNFKEKDEVYRQTANTIYEGIEVNRRDRSLPTTPKNLDKHLDQLNIELAESKVNNNLRFVEKQISKKEQKEYLVYQNGGSTIFNDVELVVTVEQFFKSLKRDESFDQYIIFRDNVLAYNSANGEVLKVSAQSSMKINLAEIGKSSTNENIDYIPLDSLNAEPDRFAPGLDVQFSAIDYKLFSTKVKIEQGEEHLVWTIFALTNTEKFEAEMKEVPEMLVIIMSISILILIFALPLIKLSLISPIERLHRSDVVLSTSSFVVCTGLLILFLLFSVSYQNDRQRIDDQLKILSEKIEDTVENDLKKVNSLMDNLESEAYSLAKSNTNAGVYIFSEDKLKAASTDYPFLKGLYWMDISGNRKYLLSTLKNEEGELSDKSFKDREYFSEIAEGRGWRAESGLIETNFYIQSITSWLNLEKLLIVSRPSDTSNIILKNKPLNPKVLAASLRFHTLLDALLPPAYSFCVTDEDGKVLFHSDSEKNLQENFLEEIGKHKEVESAYKGENSGYADVHYGSKGHRIFFKGFDKLPWVLITSYETNYIEAPYLQIISQTVIFILLIGAIAFFQLYLISLFERRPSKLKKKVYYYDWLWPKKDNNHNHFRYFKVILYLLGLILILLVYFYHLRADLNLLQVMAAFLYAILFANSSVWALLSGGTETRKVKKRKRKIYVLVGTIFTCSLIFGFIELLSPQFTRNLSILLMILVFSLLSFISLSKLFKEPPVLDKILSYKQSYWGMFTLFLLISSVLPAYFLFDASYQQEQLIWKKYNMYEISKASEARDTHLKEELYQDGSKDPRFQRAKETANYYQCLGYESCKCRDQDIQQISPTRWDSLLHGSRPFFTNMFVASNGFVFSKGGKYWETSSCKCGIRMECNSFLHSSEPPLVMASTLHGLVWNYAPDKLGGEIFWLGLGLFILFLWSIYYAIRFATNKFFAMDLFNNLQVIQADDDFLTNYFKTICNTKEKGNKHLFVVAVPYSGVHEFYKDIKNIKVFDVPQLLDSSERSKILKVKDSHILLEHFSYVIEDPQANAQILDIVEQLLNKKNTITIISRLSPTQIIDYYENRILKTRDGEKHAELQIQVSKWKDILAGFIKVFYHLQCSATSEKNSISDFDIKELLAYEFRVSKDYFKRIREAFALRWAESPKDIILNEVLKKKELDKDIDLQNYRDVKEEIILKIQSMAQPFYFSLWNTCSKEEKYLLYDLAMDGFVNTQNERGLKKLIEKGLVYYDGSLEIMNESFRNFILTTIKESESLAMERELKQSGTWSLYSSIFLILLIGLVAFVALTQQEIVSKFVALMAGLATAIPYLLKFSGFFNTLSAKGKPIE